MSLKDCSNCWSYPCTCGSEFNSSFNEYHNEETIKKDAWEELFNWLESEDYLSDSKEQIKKEFKNRKK